MNAVKLTPNAVGGALAASDGESVDAWTIWETDEWALFTAHSGVLFHHIRSALHTFHFGDVQFLFIQYEKISLATQVILDGYFALTALKGDGQMGAAELNLRTASDKLRQEML